MFKGKRSKKEGSTSKNEGIDMNDIKLDNVRSRHTSTDDKNGNGEFFEDAGRVYSRSGQSGSIGDVIDDAPKLQRGLKARHVRCYILVTYK